MPPQNSDKPVRDVAAAVILDAQGRALLLQRSPTAPYFPNCWGVVTGMIDPGETPAQAAVREIKEELGVEGAVLESGEPFTVDIGPFVARVWPFHCSLNAPDAIHLHAENQTYEWVRLHEVFTRDTVPRLDQDFRALGLL